VSPKRNLMYPLFHDMGHALHTTSTPKPWNQLYIGLHLMLQQELEDPIECVLDGLCSLD
jgi:hypothetical protein